MERFIRAGAQAIEHARRRNGGSSSVRRLDAQAIRNIRTTLGLTQKRFVERYGFDLDTLKSWESGRRTPDQSNDLLLCIIKLEPELMQSLVDRVESERRRSKSRAVQLERC